MKISCHDGSMWIWMDMRGMEETSMLLKSIETHFKGMGDKTAAAKFRNKAVEAAHRARLIHDYIFTQNQYSEDIRHQKGNSDHENKRVNSA